MADLTVFRVYDLAECGADGYPDFWHALPPEWLLDWGSSEGESVVPPGDRFGIKDVVRHEAGHRCVRCGHPYRCGESKADWSPCDERCSHRGLVRLSYRADDGSEVGPMEHVLATEAGVVVGYGKRVEAAYRVLTVHHLDGDKRNCRWWNLAALCQRCHLTIQGKVVMDRRWLHEHSPWFRPYAAGGYYAHRYLGEELTREQAVERMDELLALELRQGALL